MTSEEQNTDFTVEVIAGWLDERGFNDAATHLLEASDEVAQRISEAGYVDWLDFQHELKEEHWRQQKFFRRYAKYFGKCGKQDAGGMF